ncbi:MAG: hypothetical protein AAF170_07300 [Bacteroidota bacterium]
MTSTLNRPKPEPRDRTGSSPRLRLGLLLLAAALAAPASAQNGLPGPDPDAPLGLGMALVRTTDAPQPLTLYDHPAFDEVPHEVPVDNATALDSVTFAPGRGRVSIKTAPPDFLPEVLDIQRGRIAFRIQTLATDWVEVVTNRADSRTAWIRRDRVEVMSWPTVLLLFLVTVDSETNPLRSAPTEDAPVLATTPPDWQLRTLAVRGDWLLVSTLGLADRIPPSGWIRWREPADTGDARLLVGGIGQE